MFSDTGERILSTRDRLKMLKSQLASAKARYAPDHPDIARLQREVDGLEQDSASKVPGTATAAATAEANDARRDLERAQS